jgi:histidine triad (HIT) family protein
MPSIFTRIINGEIPCYKIAEDEYYFAFLDINPSSRGHTLVVPKEETDYIFDLDDARLQGLIRFAKPIARALDAQLSPKPMRTGIIVEGLEVPHAHLHLIPIYKPRQFFSLSESVDISKDEMAKIADQVRAGL